MDDPNSCIRYAVAEDAGAIAHIYNEAIRSSTATFDTEPKSVDERRQWLADHDERHPVLVAELNGEIVGWAALTKWSDRPAYDQTAESSCYVAEGYRGRGIGRALKERLIEEAGRVGLHTLLARIAQGSDASIHLNESVGFQHVGILKEVGLKFGQRLDVHIMQLRFDDRGAPIPATAARHDIGSTVVSSAVTAFRANKSWADKAVAQLPDEKLHVALDPHTNSIAVIMKHVAGNLLSRWTAFLDTDGEKPWRNRDDEFIDTFQSRAEIIAYWEQGWDCLFTSLQSLRPEDLKKMVTIRGEPHSVPLAIHRSLAHCGYHVGQIMMIARILAGDHWQTITIPRGQSAGFNTTVWSKGPYQEPPATGEATA